MVELEHGHHADGDRVVVRFAGLAVAQDLLAKDRQRFAGLEGSAESKVVQLSSGHIAIIDLVTFQVQLEAGFYGPLALGGAFFHRNGELFVVEDLFGLEAIVAQPFLQDRMTGVDRVRDQAVDIVAALFAQPGFQIQRPDFIVILEHLGVVLRI